jgi:hypothetical protein
VRKFRGPGNVLGAAVQLCTLPWLGFVPDEVSASLAIHSLSSGPGLDLPAVLLPQQAALRGRPQIRHHPDLRDFSEPPTLSCSCL